jgi:hypothetical protein
MMNPTILPGDEVECIFPGPWLWMYEDGTASLRDGPPLGSRWIVDALWLAGDDDNTWQDMIALDSIRARRFSTMPSKAAA